MHNTKILKLIHRLREKTETGSLGWEATASPKKFLTTLSDYSVLISEEGDDYFLTIVDSWDDVIERVSDPELKQEDRKAYETMKSLYVLARRNAKGVDEAIDDILGSIE